MEPPYYARLGFVMINPESYGSQLRVLIAHDATSIPSDARRVAMRRPLA
jgi:hypothetical protein